jgi:hypothetical protein
MSVVQFTPPDMWLIYLSVTIHIHADKSTYMYLLFLLSRGIINTLRFPMYIRYYYWEEPTEAFR